MTLNAGMLTSNTAQWNTPPMLVADIASFMGTIDLDPCSGGPHIPALRHFTLDGLQGQWRGRVYMNPPYGREIGKWVLKASTEPVDEIVMLLPARTDTAWFQPLFKQCMLCFVKGRLKFSGHENGAPFPSVIAYRGARTLHFCDAFHKYGRLVSPAGVW